MDLQQILQPANEEAGIAYVFLFFFLCRSYGGPQTN